MLRYIHEWTIWSSFNSMREYYDYNHGFFLTCWWYQEHSRDRCHRGFSGSPARRRRPSGTSYLRKFDNPCSEKKVFFWHFWHSTPFVWHRSLCYNQTLQAIPSKHKFLNTSSLYFLSWQEIQLKTEKIKFSWEKLLGSRIVTRYRYSYLIRSRNYPRCYALDSEICIDQVILN